MKESSQFNSNACKRMAAKYCQRKAEVLHVEGLLPPSCGCRVALKPAVDGKALAQPRDCAGTSSIMKNACTISIKPSFSVQAEQYMGGADICN